MTQMDPSSRVTRPLTGHRRPRPHSYTPRACDRCRTRKQRCVLCDEDDTICRNCAESNSECNLSRPGEKIKRSRGESLRIDEDESEKSAFFVATAHAERVATGHHDVSRSDGPAPVQPSHLDRNNLQCQPIALGTNPPQANLSRHDGASASLARHLPATGMQPDADWQAWISSLESHNRPEMAEQRPAQYLPAQHPSIPSHPPDPTILANIDRFAQSTSGRQPTSYTGAEIDKSTSAISQSSLPVQMPSGSTASLPPSFISPCNATSARHPISPASGVESDDSSLEEAAKGLAMISLEAAAEPHYVGESSGSLWTTVIRGGMESLVAQSAHGVKRSIHGHGLRPTRSGASLTTASSRAGQQSLDLLTAIQQPLSEDVATMILETVYRHLHPRYPFMDWVTFEKQWERRNEILSGVGQGLTLDRDSSTAAFFILMILAVGGQLCAQRVVPGLLRAEDYYVLASPYLNTIVTLHNLANIQGLLLLAIYSLRDSKGPSVWYLSGVTLRLCIGMGLHRNAAGWSARKATKYELEMRKRVFWSCYILDRMISLLLGRPTGISDDDFDVDLPDVHDSVEKPKLPSLQTASMISAVHHIKLKRIESGIQRSIYSITRRGQANDYWQLLNMLDEWEKSIPVESTSPTYWMYPSCSRDWFLLKGVEARLHLLRPLCAGDHAPGSPFVTQLAAHAARGCEIQKRMRQQGQPMSNASAHSAFTCGLALLYASFLQPTVLPLRDVFRGIKAASNTLFAYAHHAHSAEVLYDVFEDLSAACIEHVSKADSKDALSSDPAIRRASVNEWQKASSEATSNIEPTSAADYVDLFQSWGITLGGELGGQPNPVAETSWNAASLSPGNLFALDMGQGYDMLSGGGWQ